MGTSIRQTDRPETAAAALARAALSAPGVAAEAFLQAAGPGRPRGFWRRGDSWAAWWGSAWRLELDAGQAGDRFEEAAGRTAAVARPSAVGEDVPPARFFGGFAFHVDHRAVGAWAGFPSTRFDLPVFELRGAGQGAPRLLVTVPGEGRAGRERALREGEALLARIGERIGPPVTGPREGREAGATAGEVRADVDLPAVVGRELPVSREAWCRGVEAALAEIRAGRFRKVVLARPADVRLAAAPDPLRLLLRLVARADGSFPYLFEPAPGTLFLGASPELVAVREEGRFHATAVAGTAARSADPKEDERLGLELLESAKDRSEHAIGVQDMRERLLDLGADPEVDERPHLLKLRGIQHLRTDLSVRAAGGRHVLELLAAMHPTAAVSGYPREPAASFLREHESFSRGWYAGPVGWFDATGDGAFAPALRCAVLGGERARLFAGAGIVEGSDPGREWEETAMKLRPALEVLGSPEREPGT